MVDTEKLRNLVKHYEFRTRPTNGHSSDSCTIWELNTVISNTARLFYDFIAELEKEERLREIRQLPLAVSSFITSTPRPSSSW